MCLEDLWVRSFVLWLLEGFVASLGGFVASLGGFVASLDGFVASLDGFNTSIAEVLESPELNDFATSGAAFGVDSTEVFDRDAVVNVEEVFDNGDINESSAYSTFISANKRARPPFDVPSASFFLIFLSLCFLCSWCRSLECLRLRCFSFLDDFFSLVTL